MEIGLYIHIPFCVKKCPYCDFFSVEGAIDEDLYLRAILLEIELFVEALPTLLGGISPKIITLYVGGGTPSLLSPEFYRKIIAKLSSNFNFEPIELTLEANPETLNIVWLKNYRELGFNRISLGIQSLTERGLRFLGRNHTVRDVFRAIEMIVESGFENFSFDFIYGWPRQGAKTLVKELSLALEFSPPHLSLYELTVYPGTIFYRNKKFSESFKKGSEKNAKLWSLIDEFLCEKDYRHYEISNFAKENFQCKHNMLYWKFEPYLGLGAGAVSRLGDLRFKNPEDIIVYYRSLFEEKKLPFKIIEKLNKTEKVKEIIFMALRTDTGISLTVLQNQFGYRIGRDVLEVLCQQGYAQIHGDKFRLTKRGWLLHSEIVRYIWRNVEVVR